MFLWAKCWAYSVQILLPLSLKLIHTVRSTWSKFSVRWMNGMPLAPSPVPPFSFQQKLVIYYKVMVVGRFIPLQIIPRQQIGWMFSNYGVSFWGIPLIQVKISALNALYFTAVMEMARVWLVRRICPVSYFDSAPFSRKKIFSSYWKQMLARFPTSGSNGTTPSFKYDMNSKFYWFQGVLGYYLDELPCCSHPKFPQIPSHVSINKEIYGLKSRPASSFGKLEPWKCDYQSRTCILNSNSAVVPKTMRWTCKRMWKIPVRIVGRHYKFLGVLSSEISTNRLSLQWPHCFSIALTVLSFKGRIKDHVMCSFCFLILIS